MIHILHPLQILVSSKVTLLIKIFFPSTWKLTASPFHFQNMFELLKNFTIIYMLEIFFIILHKKELYFQYYIP